MEPAVGNRLNVRRSHAQNAQEGQIEVLSGTGSWAAGVDFSTCRVISALAADLRMSHTA